MSDRSLALLGASELVAGFASGEFTPVDAARAALEAIEEFDGVVNAMVLTDPDGALAAAEQSARRWASGQTLGPADGVPATVKDMLLTAGWPTLRGSRLVDEAGPWDTDSPAVARLRESGSVLLGKTTMPEFAWKGVTDSARHGVTGNPWGAHLTSGGSSGGSATAVGLGMGAWSIGTDGGGSVRIPASFTGTVALKPTFGRIPLFPPSPYGTLSHAGPMTRNVTDAALLLDLLSRPDSRDWAALPPPARHGVDGLDAGVAGLRIGFSPDLGVGTNDPAVDAAVRAAVGVLGRLGAHVEEVDAEALGGWGDPIDAFHVLWFPAAKYVLDAYGPGALDEVDPGLRAAIEEHGEASAADYLDATALRMRMGAAMGRFHETYDVLVTPTMPMPAFEAGRDVPRGWPSPLWTTWSPYAYPFNMTQQPALSLPCGLTDDERPIGLQIVGPRHADDVVLRVGRAYEAATDWHRRLPTLLRA